MFNNRKKTTFQKDQKAWEQLQNGDLDALSFLYDKYVEDLFAIGFSIYSDKDFIKDVIHDVFLDLYKYHNRLSNANNVKAYLIVSLKRSIFKKKKTKEIVLEKKDFERRLDLLESNECHENKIIKLEQASFTHKKVDYAIKSLTPHQIQVLQLKFFEEKSYKEIASDLNLTVSSARTLVYRTLKELRKKTAALLW